MSKKGFATAIVWVSLFIVCGYGDARAYDDCSGQKLEQKPDAGNQDASFNQFRESLLQAVKARDHKSLKKMLHPEIVMFYRNDNGTIREDVFKEKNQFLNKWKINDPNSPFWKIMETILLMGGSFKDSGKTKYEAPYVRSEWPENCKRSKYTAILGENVSVWDSTGSGKKEIGKLSNVIVKADYPNSPDNWVKIIIPQSNPPTEGFVRESSVRSYYDYSVRFVKQGNNWRITFFAEVPKTQKGIPPCEP